MKKPMNLSRVPHPRRFSWRIRQTDSNGLRQDVFGFCTPSCPTSGNTSTLSQTISDGRYLWGTYSGVLLQSHYGKRTLKNVRSERE